MWVCHVMDLDSDQSIIKSTKYYQYQKSILYVKRVLYISRKICLMIEAIINITNKKKYWRKYYKYCRKNYKRGRKYYKYDRKYNKYDRKYYKKIQSFMNFMSIVIKFEVL